MKSVKKTLSCLMTLSLTMTSFVMPMEVQATSTAEAEAFQAIEVKFRDGEIPEGFKTTGDYETVEADSEGYTMVTRKSVGGRAGTYVGIEDIALDGNIEIEARMKLNEHALNYDFEGYNYPGFMPMTFYADGSGVGGGKTYMMFYSNLLNIKDNGKLYAFNESKSASRPFDSMGITDATDLNVTIEADKWYTFKYILNVDGDSTTTDTWYYAVYDEDGNELVSNIDEEPYYIIYSVDGNCNYNKMESINSLYFGLHKRSAVVTEDEKSVVKSGIVTYDYVSVKECVGPALESTSIKAGEAVDVTKPITLTFDQKVVEESISNIKLWQVGEAADTEITDVSYTLSADKKTVNVILPKNIEGEKEYKLIVSELKSAENNALSETETIEFTTGYNSMLYYGEFRDGNIADGFERTNDYETVETDTEGYTKLIRKTIGRAGTYVGIEDIKLDGNVEIEARMKLNEHALDYSLEGDKYTGFMPMTFYADGDVGGGKTYMMFYSNLLNIKDNGKLYAFNESKSASRPFDSMGITDATDLNVTIEADKWYTFKYILNVDGDSTTTDTWYYAVYDEDGNELVSNIDAEPYYIIYSVDGNCNYNKMESINSLYFGLHKRTGNVTENSETVMKSGTVTYDYVLVKECTGPKLVNTSIKAEENVEISEAVTFTFDQKIVEESISNIELWKTDETGDKKVSGIKTALSEDKKTVTVNLPQNIEGEKEYKFIVSGIQSAENKVASGTEIIEFKTGYNSMLYYGEFRDGNIADGFERTNDYETVEADSEGYTKLIRKTIGRAGTYVGIEDITLDGKLEIEARMKLNEHALNYNLEGDKYTGFMPMTFYADGDVGGGKNYMMFYSNLLNIKDNGQLYAFNESKSASRPYDSMGITDATDLNVTIEADKWYTFKYILNVDGDSTTTDTWYYAVYDESGNELVSNIDAEPYYIIYSVDGNCNYNKMESINSLYFGLHKRTGNVTENGETVMKSGAVTYDYIAVRKEKEPSYELSVNSEVLTDAIPVDGDVVINFSENMNSEKFADITVLENGNEMTDVIITPTSGVTNKCTLDFERAYGSTYTINVPGLYTADGDYCKAKEIKLTVAPWEGDVINISGVLDKEITADTTVNVTLSVENLQDVENNAVCAAALYDASGKMRAVASQSMTLTANETNSSFAPQFKVPTDIGNGAYIKLMVWDSFEDATPLCDAVIPVVAQ